MTDAAEPRPMDGSAKIVQAILNHPASAVTLFGGIAGAIIFGTAAWYQINNDLHEKGTQILSLQDSWRRSSDKLDRLSNDIGDVKVNVQKVGTSVEFLVKQWPWPSSTPPSQERRSNP